MPVAPRTKWRSLIEELWGLPPSMRIMDVAYRARLGKTHVYRILRGMIVPNRSVSIRLAKVLGMSYGEFMRRLDKAVEIHTGYRQRL